MSDPTLLDAIDPDLADKLTSRRGLFVAATQRLGVLASAPVVLASVSGDAFGQGASLPKEIADVLNFALTLEYLEDEFYRTGLSRGVVPSNYRQVFETISRHESAHVAALKGALGSLAVTKPDFDFTAKGRYAAAFSDFSTFASLSQTFEDLGVAAYKGQAGNLMGNSMLLTTALQIHSVEARHAAEVRRIRGVRAWTGAFDKAASKQQVLAAARPFIA